MRSCHPLYERRLKEPETLEYIVPGDAHPQRADKLLFELLAGSFSRTLIARMIREGRVVVHGRKIKASTVLRPSEKVVITAADAEPMQSNVEPPHTSLSILFEDDHLMVIDKPPGLTVHHGGGRSSGTLVDILVRDRPEIIGVGEAGRWGIVHRLDKDTSGVMAIAKTNEALSWLSRQFKEHSVTKIYHAIVRGAPQKDEGIVSRPIGRHATDRKRMSVAAAKSRTAVTKWRVVNRLGEVSLLEIRPETGRTHQIRVHLAAIGLPILGDPVYGRMRRRAKHIPHLVEKCAHLLNRQALHASLLGVAHPVTGQYLQWTSPIPQDMEAVIACLKGNM
jgi:23S rRNA pseudouridine1911/1915/1917 synthase